MNLVDKLSNKVQQSLIKNNLGDEPIVLQATQNIAFGDFQLNSIMGIAKRRGIDGFELAQKIAADLDVADLVEKVEVVRPAFINFHLNRQYVADQAKQALNSADLAVTKQPTETIVIDYSSPNLAKEMHVGHLRSTIIGDTINRILTFLGHRVIAQNHVGDWGTQFGMLTAYLMEVEKNEDHHLLLADLEQFYRQAKIRFDEDEEFANKARNFVVLLQGGDEKILSIWQRFVDLSLKHCQDIYTKLGVLLKESDVMGESKYNEALKPTVDDLVNRGIAVDDEGAKVVFLEDFKQQDDKPTPFIIQKKDGGFLYSTTDIACVRYRVNELKVNRVLYVVDSRQSLHFQELFYTVRKAGYAPENVELTHIAFGTMLGKNGKPFKTREGTTFKLIDLLTDAIDRAQNLVREKNPGLDEQSVATIAEAVGISAIKYADLSKNRINDYIFNWDAMLSFEGNTAPYLQYAYTRLSNILKKADPVAADTPVATTEPIEKQLAILLLQFEDVLYKISTSYNPNYLTTYLYNIANLTSKFYESCPILQSAEPIKQQRLQLAKLTANTLKTGLDLLGIKVLATM